MMWLAQPVSNPSYSGLFLRKTFAQLSKSTDSPILRSAEIYGPLGGKYHASNKQWSFPSGAIIEFGHMQHSTDTQNYQGARYHRVAYDELTQFSEDQYLYLFSRIRKDPNFEFPLGVRAATNPGGPGHEWVRKRFIPDKVNNDLKRLGYTEKSPEGLVYKITESRCFVPARVADNPSLDIDDYLERVLGHLPIKLRQQLAAGDWDAVEGSLIQTDWFRYFTFSGDNLHIPNLRLSFSTRLMNRFVVVDTAGTSKDKVREKRGKPPAYSVVSVWDHWRPLNILFLRHIWRGRVEWNELKAVTTLTCRQWGVRKGYCENAHYGPVLMKEVSGLTWVPVGPVIPGMRDNDVNAKLDRAVAAGLFKRFEKGQIYFPDIGSVEGVMEWLPDYERELMSWTGDPDETCDQIDVSSYASHVTGRLTTGGWGGVIKPGVR